MSSAILLLALFSPAVLLAQSNTQGWIYGKITLDGSNGVEGATVTATSATTGISRSTETSASGAFRFNTLAPGAYNIVVSSNDGQAAADSVDVTLGNGSAVNMTLSSDSAELGSITVSGSAISTVDISSSETAHNITAAELLNQPVVRDLNAVILTAPGAVLGDSAFGSEAQLTRTSYNAGFGFASIGGSSVAENSYYINGFNVTNARNGLGSSTVPFQFYDQFQIKEGGYSAEFGRSIGGAINTTTKSGTNEWTFGAGMYYEPESLRGTGSDSIAPDGSYLTTGSIDEKDTTNYYVEVGGPIIKDKLFFYGIYQERDSEWDNFTNSELRANKDDDPFWGAKIDWNITDNHLLEVTGFSDQHDAVRESFVYDRNVGFGYAGVGASKGDTIISRGGDNYIVNYTGHLTDNFTVSAMYGTSEYNLKTGAAADANCPLIWDSRSGSTVVLGCSVNNTPESGFDERDAYRLDMVWDIGDNHRLKFGYDVDEFVSQQAQTYSGSSLARGGLYWRYFADNRSSTGFSARERHFDGGGSFDTNATAFYIEDEWQVNDKLMVRLGARAEEFENKNANGQTFIKLSMSDQIAPRLGFSYDVAGDGRSKVYGSYGTYYMPVAANTNIRMSGAEFFTEDFFELISIGADGLPTIGPQISASVFGDGSVPDTSEILDTSIEAMDQNEIILGYERELFDGGWVGGVRATYRELGTALEDIAIDAAVIARHPQAAGCYTGFHAYVLTNPGSDMTVATTPTADCSGPLVTETYSAAELGYPEAERDYTALTLYANKVWDGKWSMNASYVWSESKGNNEGYVRSDNGQDDAGITTNFDQPGLTDFGNGKLPNSRDHQFKFYGNYQIMDNLMGGAAFTWSSGRPLNGFGVHPTDVFAAAYGSESFFTQGQPVPRGSVGEGESIKNLDLMLKYDMAFGQKGNLTLKLDVFNVFNWDAVTEVDELGDEDVTSPGGPANDTYLLPTNFQAERSMRLGLFFSF
jgi:outer membrane receptor for ferrienterochelin and colicin